MPCGNAVLLCSCPRVSAMAYAACDAVCCSRPLRTWSQTSQPCARPVGTQLWSLLTLESTRHATCCGAIPLACRSLHGAPMRTDRLVAPGAPAVFNQCAQLRPPVPCHRYWVPRLPPCSPLAAHTSSLPCARRCPPEPLVRPRGRPPRRRHRHPRGHPPGVVVPPRDHRGLRAAAARRHSPPDVMREGEEDRGPVEGALGGND